MAETYNQKQMQKRNPFEHQDHCRFGRVDEMQPLSHLSNRHYTDWSVPVPLYGEESWNTK